MESMAWQELHSYGFLYKKGERGGNRAGKKVSGVLTFPLSTQGGTFRDPVAEVLSGQRRAVVMTALNLSVFFYFIFLN